MEESSNFKDIVAKPLRAETKEDWFEWVKNYLISKDLWKVTSTSARPERYRVKDYARWRRKNAAALHVLHISCGPHNLPFLRGASEAKVAWDILWRTYHSPPPLGRVSGEARGVSFMRYFGQTSSHSRQSEYIRELVDKIQEEVRQSIREEVQEELELEICRSLMEKLCGKKSSMVMSSIQAGMGQSEHRSQEEVQKKQAEGSFVPDERNDIMTVAIEKHDHPDRVMGVGGVVGIMDHFGSSKHHSLSVFTMEEKEQMVATVKAEATAQAWAEAGASIDAIIEAQMSKMKDEIMMIVRKRQETSVPKAHLLAPMQSTKGSCCIIGQSSEGPGIAEHGDIFVGDPLRRLMHNLRSTIHHQQIQDDQVKVLGEEVIIDDALVPIPTSDLKIVSDAKGIFILCPKNLISNRDELLEETPTKIPEHVSKLKLNDMQEGDLMVYHTSFTTRWWPMDEVAGKSAVSAYLDMEDLKSLMDPKQGITVAIVQIFLMYMHRRLVSWGKNNDFGFICPIQITEKGTTAAIRHKYLSQRLSETKIEYFLAPYVHDDHWQLVLLCKKNYTVVFLCSLHHPPGNDLESTINSAMKTFRHSSGGKNVHEVKDPKWIIPKTRRQPPESNLCGLYVLRHIFNIITSELGFTQEFGVIDPFTKEDIDVICKCCYKFILELLKQ